MRFSNIVLFLSSVLLVAPVSIAADDLAVKTLPARNGLRDGHHEIVAGRSTSLKAVSSLDGVEVEATWDFGDSSAPVSFALTNRFDVSARHVYTGASGTRFVAKLTVVDKRTGASAGAEYRVVLREPSLEIEANLAMEEGLWYLHRTMNRATESGSTVLRGDWRGSCGKACDGSGAVNASNVLAFESSGFRPSGDPDHPYTETVIRGLNSLLGQAADPAARTSDWVKAIEMAHDPARRAETGPAGILGRTFQEILDSTPGLGAGITRSTASQSRDSSVGLMSPEAARALIGRQHPEGYWASEGNPTSVLAFETSRSVAALSVRFRPEASSTIFNVSGQVSVTTSGFLYSRATRTYNGTMTVTNISANAIPGPINVVLTNLTSGVTLVNAAGTFNGNPYVTLPGVTTFAAGQAVTVNLSFDNPANAVITSVPVTYSGTFPPAPVTLGCPAATGTNGVAYSSTLLGEGGVQIYVYAIGPGVLPTGLQINTTTGAIAGTPTANGAFNFTATLVDGTGLPSGTAAANCTITISPPATPLTLACPASTGQVGVAYSSALAASGGVPPYTYSISAGALPSPLNLSASTGAITGTPAVAGANPFTGQVTDSTPGSPQTTTASCGITVSEAATVAVTVTTVPAGLSIVVDGNTLTAPQVFNWVPGSNHTIAATTPQGSGGTRQVFANWSDGGAISHSVTAPASATTFTATFNTEYQLTTAASPTAGGTVTPASGSFFPAGSVQNVSATANSGFTFANWTGPVADANAASTTVTMSGPVSITGNFSANVGITVTTNPPGLSIIVDGNTLTAPQVFNWVPGSNHTIATTTPQGSGGTRQVFANWSDGGAISHSVTAPASATTFTATFNTEYQLTTAVSPAAGGTVTPASGSFFPAGSVQNVSATANSGFTFANWTGPVADANAASTTVTMSGPVSITGNFSANVGITVTTNPPGLSIVVDGNTLTAPQVFNWVPGSNHTIATTTPQGSGGTRQVFANWSDGGAISHSVTAPASATTFTATFNTEYQLTTAVSPAAGGTVTPASGSFFPAGSVQNVSATANSGFTFANWTGPVADANAASTTVTMSGPVSITANFSATVGITVTTNPPGLSIIVDGNTLTAPQVFNWTPGSNHTIATTTPQGSGGTRQVFSTWSDGGAIAHAVTAPASATTFTANFNTEHQLTIAASPTNGGTVTPASGTFFPAGSVQNVSATANSGFTFANWTGPVATASAASTTVTMSGPVSITANFTATVGITVTTNPVGLSIVVDGNTLTAPQVFNWVPGSNHTIATTTPQGSGGTRRVFANWSDGGAISHAVTAPASATTFTANFNTEFQLTTAVSPAGGGTVTPASGSFFASGSVQTVTATPNGGFAFVSWTGPVANASAASTTVTMSGPVSITANFATALSLSCPAVTTAPIGTPYSSSLTASGGTAPLTYSIQSGSLPPPLTINPANGLISGTPTTKGTYNFVGRVADSSSPTQQVATANCSIVVPNRLPTATTQSVTTNEDTAIVITLAGSDPDGDNLTFTTTNPGRGTLSAPGVVSCAGTAPRNCTRTITYTPSANLNGADSFTFVVNDGTANSPSATVNITVNPVNDAPVIVTKSYNVQTNMRVVIPVGSGLLSGVTDPDSVDAGFTPVFTVASVSAPSQAGAAVTVNAATGELTFDPPAGFTGNVTFTHQVCDNGRPAPAACTGTTVTMVVSGNPIWFVNPASGTNGNGTLQSPFNLLSSANTAMGTNANHGIFVYSGTTTSGTGVTLQANSRLIGQGVTVAFDTAFGITPPATTVARPTTSGAQPIIQGTINLNGSNAQVRGLRIQPPASSVGLQATAATVTGLVVNDIANITTSSARAVNLTNASGTISVTAVSSSNADVGINLSNVNTASGSFAVLGNGGTCTAATPTCSGGTISNATNAGILLSSANNITLTRMRINGSGNFGLSGTNVSVMNIDTSVFDGVHGNAVNEGALFVSNWLTNGTISNSEILGGANDNVRITNTSGVLNRLNITNSIIRDNSTGPNGNHGLRFATNLASGAGAGVVMNLTVTGTRFTNNRSNHIDTGATGLSTMDIVLNNNTLQRTNAALLAGAVNITGDHQADVTFDVNGNNSNGAQLSAFNFFQSNQTTAAASMIGRFRNNLIGTAGVANSGSLQGDGVAFTSTGLAAMTVSVTGNSIRQFNNTGIIFNAGDTSPVVNATVTGNTIKEGTNIALNAIHFNMGSTAAGAVTACADIGGATTLRNDVAGAIPAVAGGVEIRVRQRNSSTFRLPGLTGAVDAFLAGRNTVTNTAAVTFQGTLSGGAGCTQVP